jgi:hypothetical protein
MSTEVVPETGRPLREPVLAWGSARTPPLRSVLATLLCQADEADMAIAHVRLLAIDLSREESTALARCRLLLGRLDAAALGEGAAMGPPLRFRFDDHDAPTAGPGPPHFARLLRLIDAGRVRVRSGGAASWAPDFSIFRGLPVSEYAPHGALCLLGAHYFARPLAGPGEALTAVLASASAVRTLTQSFDALWERGHDVEEAVRGVLAEFVAA